MNNEDDKLQLIYVLKIGYNSKGEGLYEFLFSYDITNILIEDWCWDISPACDNALPPTEQYINGIYSLKTNSFDLFCLHEAVDREYMHGYHTIHCLAYEIEKQIEDGGGAVGYERMFENGEEDNDMPLLVFHYGMTLGRIKDMLNARKIILKDKEFLEVSSLKL